MRHSQINYALAQEQIVARLSFDSLLEENFPRYFQVFYHFSDHARDLLNVLLSFFEPGCGDIDVN